jgi:hypothetical protein
LIVAAGVAGAAVAMGAPLVAAVVALRRSTRDLQASAGLQHATLEIERERLQATLRADDDRARRGAERAVLDRGAVLLTEFRGVVAGIRLDARGKPMGTDAWRESCYECSSFCARLSLWFDEGSEIVAAFDEIVRLADPGTTWATELRSGERRVRLTRPSDARNGESQSNSHERTLEDLEACALRYMRAARAHLRAA